MHLVLHFTCGESGIRGEMDDSSLELKGLRPHVQNLSEGLEHLDQSKTPTDFQTGEESRKTNNTESECRDNQVIKTMETKMVQLIKTMETNMVSPHVITEYIRMYAENHKLIRFKQAHAKLLEQAAHSRVISGFGRDDDRKLDSFYESPRFPLCGSGYTLTALLNESLSHVINTIQVGETGGRQDLIDLRDRQIVSELKSVIKTMRMEYKRMIDDTNREIKRLEAPRSTIFFPGPCEAFSTTSRTTIGQEDNVNPSLVSREMFLHTSISRRRSSLHGHMNGQISGPGLLDEVHNRPRVKWDLYRRSLPPYSNEGDETVSRRSANDNEQSSAGFEEHKSRAATTSSARRISPITPLHLLTAGLLFIGQASAQNTNIPPDGNPFERPFEKIAVIFVSAIAPATILTLVSVYAILLLWMKAEGAMAISMLGVASIYITIPKAPTPNNKEDEDRYVHLAVGMSYIILMLTYCRLVMSRNKFGKVFCAIATSLGIALTMIVMAFPGTCAYWRVLTALHSIFALLLAIPLSFGFCDLVVSITNAVNRSGQDECTTPSRLEAAFDPSELRKLPSDNVQRDPIHGSIPRLRSEFRIDDMDKDAEEIYISAIYAATSDAKANVSVSAGRRFLTRLRCLLGKNKSN